MQVSLRPNTLHNKARFWIKANKVMGKDKKGKGKGKEGKDKEDYPLIFSQES